MIGIYRPRATCFNHGAPMVCFGSFWHRSPEIQRHRRQMIEKPSIRLCRRTRSYGFGQDPKRIIGHSKGFSGRIWPQKMVLMALVPRGKSVLMASHRCSLSRSGLKLDRFWYIGRKRIWEVCKISQNLAGPCMGNAKPIHPAAMRGLYVVYIAACLVERTWRFALPLVLSYINGGYRAIAVLGFVSPLFVSLLGPIVGSFLDKIYRPYGLGLMLTLQDIAIIASGVVVILSATTPGASLANGPLFSALLALSGVERLTAVLSELAIERDWVTQLSGRDNDIALATSNAILRRGDLVCEAIGAMAFGWLYSCSGLVAAVAVTVILAAVAVPLQLYFILFIAKRAPDAMVHGRGEATTAPIKPPTWKQLLNVRKDMVSKTSKAKRPIRHHMIKHYASFLDGWKTYFRQPILFSSLTFVLLFLNVALSPGGLITAFLTSKGLDGKGMAMFRGGCAFMGFTGTAVGRWLIRNYGLLEAGKKALLIQFSCLLAATIVYFTSLSGEIVIENKMLSGFGHFSTPVVIFSAAVVVSRIGMWSFDMVNAQLFQQTVNQREVAAASAAEIALCNTNELLMLGAAAYLISPSSYFLLVAVSIAAVFGANVLFRNWTRRIEENGDEDFVPTISGTGMVT